MKNVSLYCFWGSYFSYINLFYFLYIKSKVEHRIRRSFFLWMWIWFKFKNSSFLFLSVFFNFYFILNFWCGDCFDASGALFFFRHRLFFPCIYTYFSSWVIIWVFYRSFELAIISFLRLKLSALVCQYLEALASHCYWEVFFLYAYIYIYIYIYIYMHV